MNAAGRKAALRARLQGRRAQVPPEAALAAAGAAAGHLSASGALDGPGRIALYAPLADELPTRPCYEEARRRERSLLWPRLEAGGALRFAPCPRWEDLRPGRYGVPEPPAETPAEPLAAGDLVLVPGLAFDRAGRRLGRGGGHYDRALAEAGAGVIAIGVGYAFQLLDEDLPEEPHDRRVAGVLTERGLWRVAQA